MSEIIKLEKSTLVYSPLSDRETASLGVFFKIGSRCEQKHLKGIAHFLEHMVFKGSSKFSHKRIKRQIEGRGGSLNAFTSQEVTAYYAHFLSKNLNPTLDILLDMALNPLFKVNEINKERNVILEEIKMYNDLGSSRAAMIFDSLLWKRHPLGQEVIGYSNTVKNIDQKELFAFHKSYYRPANMVVSFGGSLDKEILIKCLNERLKLKTLEVKSKYRRPQDVGGICVGVEKKNLEQTHLCLGFRSVSYRSPDRLTAQLLNIILGANMSSRLFEELREKRSLCYDISTELRKYKDSGAFVVHTGLDKSKVIIAIQTIIKELDKLKHKKVSNKELTRAKDYLLGQIAMTLENPQGRMFYQAESFLALGKTFDINEIKEKVGGISVDDIMVFARKIFNFKNICISCVGNIDDGLEAKIREVVS